MTSLVGTASPIVDLRRPGPPSVDHLANARPEESRRLRNSVGSRFKARADSRPRSPASTRSPAVCNGDAAALEEVAVARRDPQFHASRQRTRAHMPSTCLLPARSHDPPTVRPLPANPLGRIRSWPGHCAHRIGSYRSPIRLPNSLTPNRSRTKRVIRNHPSPEAGSPTHPDFKLDPGTPTEAKSLDSHHGISARSIAPDDSALIVARPAESDNSRVAFDYHGRGALDARREHAVALGPLPPGRVERNRLCENSPRWV